MLRNILLFTFFFSFFSLKIWAQGDVKIGQWRTYLPYQKATYVTQSNSHVYYSTGFSILKMDKTDLSIDRIDRLDGLSESTPTIIRYNKANNNLMIVYANSTIDLIKSDGDVVTLNDIKSNNSIIGDKKVYDIFFTSDTAYLACGFGIVKLNMKRNEFIYTTFTKKKVNSIAVFNGRLYAATEGGIYTVNNDSRINLADFSTWQLLNDKNGFPAQAYNSNALCIFNGRLYMDVSDTLKVLQDNNTPLSILYKNRLKIQYLTAEGNNLLIGLWCGDDCSGEIYVLNKNNNLTPLNSCSLRPLYAIEDAQGKIYFADLYDPIKSVKNIGAPCDQFTLESPIFAGGSSIAVSDSSFIVAAGGLDASNNARISAEGFAEYKSGKWIGYNRFNFSALQEKEADLAMQAVAINPQNGKLYCGTFWGGLIEASNNKILNIYNDKNSTLQGAFGDEQRERVSGLVFDNNGNLWVSNSSAPYPISVLKSDGKWKQMGSVPTGGNFIFQVAMDSSGNKWFVVGSAIPAMLIYNEGKNIDDLSDDKIRLIDNSLFPKELQTARVNCVTVDLDGTVWIGTTNGVARFDCGNDPFREGCTARLIISSLGGISEYLLRERNVQAITVDGANRKWFGTTSGIFVTSPDGREEVAKFNTENSPLMSNNITALGVRQKTGEIFVATARGIMSYRTDAIAGEEFNRDTAYAFPNPVRPDYQGPIAIKGLARDANVKITDANGNIVYETEALGGQAIWNGLDFSGRRVATGVYLVFATNTRNLDAPEAIVTKILFIN